MNKITIKQRFNRESDLLSFCYTDPEDSTIEHTHEFHELVVVDKGCGVNVLNGELYFIQEGDVFFINHTDRHCYSELGTLTLMNILINPNIPFQYIAKMNDIFSQLQPQPESVFFWLMPNDKEHCLELTSKILKIYKELSTIDDQILFSIETMFMQIIDIILTSQKAIQKNSTQYKMRHLLNFLQKNYADQIDWQCVSEEFFVTNKTMTRKIKELTGMSPVNYLNRLRVLSAREKLRQTDDLIIDISISCGFQNSDYFTKCYRKNFGVSPSEERKLIKN